jgi:hypothetical protein
MESGSLLRHSPTNASSLTNLASQPCAGAGMSWHKETHRTRRDRLCFLISVIASLAGLEGKHCFASGCAAGASASKRDAGVVSRISLDRPETFCRLTVRQNCGASTVGTSSSSDASSEFCTLERVERRTPSKSIREEARPAAKRLVREKGDVPCRHCRVQSIGRSPPNADIGRDWLRRESRETYRQRYLENASKYVR